jgi:hypothetical protein
MTEAFVNLTESKIVLARQGRELIRLDTQRINLAPSLVSRAQSEVLARDRGGNVGYRFGFLLGVDNGRDAPAARRLANQLDRELVDPVGACRRVKFSLSFLKAVEGHPPATTEGPLFAGFHLDTHPDIASDDGPELIRVLVNLAQWPRTVRFVCADRFELAAAGLHLPRTSFQVVDPPTEFDHSIVEIPPFAGRAISYLTFWASLVPHVGIERPEGHFLASFEATTNA